MGERGLARTRLDFWENGRNWGVRKNDFCLLVECYEGVCFDVTCMLLFLSNFINSRALDGGFSVFVLRKSGWPLSG